MRWLPWTLVPLAFAAGLAIYDLSNRTHGTSGTQTSIIAADEPRTQPVADVDTAPATDSDQASIPATDELQTQLATDAVTEPPMVSDQASEPADVEPPVTDTAPEKPRQRRMRAAEQPKTIKRKGRIKRIYADF